MAQNKMQSNIPFRFFVFNEQAKACDSSGSDHFADSMHNLLDRVNSFLERGYAAADDDEGKNNNEELNNKGTCSGLETKKMLRNLLGVDVHDDVKEMIRNATTVACEAVGKEDPGGFKRRIMLQLREQGLDAGLCKSKWDKLGRFPGGDFEYIDVLHNETRYIVEVSLSSEFSIARPTSNYQSLLDIFPEVFVGKADELQEVVQLMCSAGKESMKNNNMLVPPWRKKTYIHAKWFSSYKRTTRNSLEKTVEDSSVGTSTICKIYRFVGGTGKCTIGFDTGKFPVRFCGGESKMRVENLVHAFNGMDCN